MTTVKDADRIPAAELQSHIAGLWRRQRAHVAANSPFYRTLWQGRPPPEDLRDLPELPLSDKAQLRVSQAANPPFGDYLAAPVSAANRMHRTSGTTGQAMNLALSAKDALITQEIGGRCHVAAGLTPAHTVVHCLN
ncbi:MAG TPA: phenylacetate--CoA ligase family protein, partial [Thermohalobaculum sp.]|nr:phenylacetate--CoA ligase family protein [Thermohalobaculum sp.]